MSKKPMDENVKFDDIDFDQELDFGGMDAFSPPKHKGREVVEEAGKSFLSGIKQGVTDTNFIRRLVGLSMPKGYSQLFNAYDGTRQAIGKVYADNESELRPHLAKANRVLTQRKSRLKYLLPKSLRNAMEDAEYREKGQSYISSDTGELQQALSGLDSLFKLDVEGKVEERIESQRRELKEDKKFELGLFAQTDLSAGIGRIVTYQDKILINYHRKSLEIGYRQFDVQHRLLLASDAFFKDSVVRLDAISKNTAMPDYVKLKTSEAIKDRLRQKLADAAVGGLTNFRSNYFKKVTDNVSGFVGGALSLGNLAGGMTSMGGMSKGQMAGSILGQQLSSAVMPSIQYGAEHLADLAAPTLQKIPGVKSTGDALRMFFADPVGALNRFRQSPDEDTGLKGWAKSALKAVLPAYTPSDKIYGTGVESLGDEARFDSLFYTSVTQIMPGYLESMDRSLRSLVSGTEEEGQAWSHYTGGMVSRSTLDAQHLRIGVFRGQGQSVRKEISEFLGKLGADDLSPEAKRILSKRMYMDMQKGQGFQPGDYVKPGSWPETTEDIADELIDFFAEKFDLDNEGKPIGNDKSFIADMAEAFKDSSERLPRSLERARILAERIMGRDTFRRLGLSQYDGYESDTVNTSKWTDTLLGADPIEVVRPKEEAEGIEKQKGLMDRLKAMPAETRKKYLEEEEKQRLAKEQAMTDGKYDVIDTVQRPFSPSGKIRPITPAADVKPLSSTAPSSPTFTLPEWDYSKLTFGEFKDEGTHIRLDAILARMDSMGQLTPGENRLGNAIVDWVGKGSESAKKGYRLAKSKAVEKAGDLKAKAKAWYDESPKVQNVVARIEQTYGKVTDPELRAQLIQAIYEHTGTPDEIYAYLSEKFEVAKEELGERYDQGKTFVKGKYDLSKAYLMDVYGQRDVYKKKVVDKATEIKDTAVDAFHTAKDTATDVYRRRGEIYEDTKDRVKELGTKTHDKLGEIKDTITGWLEKRALSTEFSDLGTHDRLDMTNQLLSALLDQSGFSGGGDGSRPDSKPGIGKRLLGMGGSAIKGAAKGLWGYTKWSYGLIGKGLKAGAGLASSAIGGTLGFAFNRPTWGVRDVLVIGDPKPRLRASDIRGGRYLDINTEKVIQSLKDITGPVRDLHTGNEVISQEEFDEEKLVDGKGDSLVKWLGRKTVGLAMGTIGATLSAYGFVGKAIVGVGSFAFEKLKDQFTQFDAYFPGDEEPRIRSKLLKQGFYRNEDGSPLRSLKDIAGPVFDIDGNEIISQDEINRFKSLYTRNGSLLFTFGRGLVSATKFGGELAWKAAKLAMWPGIQMAKGMWNLTKKAAKGSVNLVKRLFTGKSTVPSAEGGVGGLSDSILHDQLQIQIEILNTLKARESKERSMGDSLNPFQRNLDSDGDGDRDNSWADIIARRAERNKKSPNADVVAAIDSLGKRLEDNFDDLSEAVTDAGEGGQGILGGIWDTIKGWGAALLAALGIGKGIGSAIPDISVGGKGGVGSVGPDGKPLPKRKGPAPKKQGLLRRAATKLGGLAWSATKGLGNMAWQVTKFAAQRVVVPVAIAAANVAGAIVTAVGMPAILVGAAIGAIGYVGYRFYKGMKFDQKPLFHLRMTQYGVSPSDGDWVEQILQLETLMAPAIKGIDNPYPNFDPQKVDMKRIYQIFGLLPEGDEVDESTIPPERQKQLVSWLAYRFKPVYLKHCSALSVIAKTIDLNKADDVIKSKEDMATFLDNVQIVDGQSMYDAIEELTPFDDELDCDNDDVVDAFKRCRGLVKDRPAKVKDAPKDTKVEAPTPNKPDTTPVKKDAAPKPKPTPRPLSRVEPVDPSTVKAVEKEEDLTVPSAMATAAGVGLGSKVNPLPNPNGGKGPLLPDAGMGATVIAGLTTEALHRHSKGEVTKNSELANPAFGSREVSSQVEKSAIESIKRSSTSMAGAMQQAVNTLSSIDGTLMDIAREIRLLPPSLKRLEENTAKPEEDMFPSLANFGKNWFTGKPTQAANNGGMFDTPLPRSNVSVQRPEAIN